MYQAKSGVKKFSLYWDQDPPSPPHPRLDEPTQNSETWDPHQGWISLSKNLIPGTPPPNPRLDWDLSKAEGWISLSKNLRLGDPPSLPTPSKAGWAYLKFWDLGPPLPPPQGWISLSKNLRPGTPPPLPPIRDWIGTCPRLKAGSGTPPPPWTDTHLWKHKVYHPRKHIDHKNIYWCPFIWHWYSVIVDLDLQMIFIFKVSFNEIEAYRSKF